MPQLTIDIPDLVARRLLTLAPLRGTSMDELVLEALDSFASSFATRRAIVKARRAEAKAAGTNHSLADLGWVDGYSGQSVDELLSFEGTEEAPRLVVVLAQAIQEKVKSSGIMKMSGVERMILSTMALWHEVNNGGYDQFFRNSSRRVAPVIVADLLRIGCPEIADISQTALDALNLPKVSVEAIEEAMSTASVDRRRTLDRCDIAFYDKGNLLAERLFIYAKKHQGGIRI
jgi:hypothetical protein